MENEIKCTNCKEGKHLQRRLDNYPEEMEFYQCDVCGSVWENEKIISLKDLLGAESDKTQEAIKGFIKKDFYGDFPNCKENRILRAEIIQEYTAFCVECDRGNLPLITFNDYCKL